MGIKKSSLRRTKMHMPLRLDRLARDLCKCYCHTGEDNPHVGISCACIPKYSLDGHALSVVQLREREVT